MGQRLLEVDAELVAALLHGFRRADGSVQNVKIGRTTAAIRQTTQYYEVVGDPIPADARILSIRYSPYYPNVIEIFLESKSWPEAALRTRVQPVVRSITVPAAEEDVVQAADRLNMAVGDPDCFPESLRAKLDELDTALRNCPGTKTRDLHENGAI